MQADAMLAWWALGVSVLALLWMSLRRPGLCRVCAGSMPGHGVSWMIGGKRSRVCDGCARKLR